MKRKIVQISSMSGFETTYPALLALCDDGTLWMHDFFYDAEVPWAQIQDVPQKEPEVPDDLA